MDRDGEVDLIVGETNVYYVDRSGAAYVFTSVCASGWCGTAQPSEACQDP